MDDKNRNLKTILTIIVTVIVVGLSIIPFIENYKFNDNHLNWLNHDYCKNLMTSVELNSVFMTEGGDNQVFGSLYFIYAEKLRPDLTPYDQKGNIFKRIYGDMRYIDIITLTNRQQMVDTGLFDSQEPFYEDIRSWNPPYFIPYWQGDRSVYLTWERPNPSTLGDFYYKRYGIMYKAQEIEYKLVDYLALKQEITFDHAVEQFEGWLDRDRATNFTSFPKIGVWLSNVTEEYVQEKIDLMVDAGYINQSVNGQTLTFNEMYDSPHDVDYFDKFLLRWDETPNAQYWDFLTREIIVNYDYQMGEIYRQEIADLEDIRERETRQEILDEIDRQIWENWEKAKEHYEDAIFYGSDSISILHNVAVVYLNTDKEDMDERAHDLLTNALEMYPTSWGTYTVMFTHLITEILENPASEDTYLDEWDYYYERLKENLEKYREAEVTIPREGGFGKFLDKIIPITVSVYSNHSSWGSYAGLDSYVASIKQTSGTDLLANEEVISNQLENDPDNLDLYTAQEVIYLLYSRGLPFLYTDYTDRADYYLRKMIDLYPSNATFNQWALTIVSQLGWTEETYILAKRLESLGASDEDYYYYYQMGTICTTLEYYYEALEYYEKFLEAIAENRIEYMKWNQAGYIDSVKATMTEISNYLGI